MYFRRIESVGERNPCEITVLKLALEQNTIAVRWTGNRTIYEVCFVRVEIEFIERFTMQYLS